MEPFYQKQLALNLCLNQFIFRLLVLIKKEFKRIPYIYQCHLKKTLKEFEIIKGLYYQKYRKN